MDITTIPVIGLVVQLVIYLVDVLPDLAPIAIALAAPLALGAMCGVIGERSGVVNIGIEGMMLIAAFMGFIVAGFTAQAFPMEPLPIFGATPALLLGVAAAVLSAMAVGLLHAWLSISIRADQIISGTIINIAALGLTGYFLRLLISPNPRLGAGTFAQFDPPAALTSIPVIGWIFNAFLHHGPITISVIFIVVALQVLLFRSRWGLRTRATGENPEAADTVGVDVIRLRYRNVVISAAFAGLAGAWLTLEATSSFQNGMTTGRGFIALAAVITGRWTPIGAWGAALLFAFSDALQVAISLRPPSGELGQLLNAIPHEAYASLPYLLTIIILAGVVGRSVPPAADGRPYAKEARA
jgi:general nucleoside transport system permease protein